MLSNKQRSVRRERSRYLRERFAYLCSSFFVSFRTCSNLLHTCCFFRNWGVSGRLGWQPLPVLRRGGGGGRLSVLSRTSYPDSRSCHNPHRLNCTGKAVPASTLGDIASHLSGAASQHRPLPEAAVKMGRPTRSAPSKSPAKTGVTPDI